MANLYSRRPLFPRGRGARARMFGRSRPFVRIPPRLRGYVRTAGSFATPRQRARELKFKDVGLALLAQPTGAVQSVELCKIAQGAGDQQRIGRRVLCKQVEVTGRIFMNGADLVGGAALFHLYLVLDTQANGALPAVGDVLTGSALAEALPFLDNVQRFKIIKEWHIPLASQAIESGGSGAGLYNFSDVVKYIHWKKNVNIPLDYSGADGVIAQVRSNNLLLICGSTGITADSCDFGGTWRMRYYDS